MIKDMLPLQTRPLMILTAILDAPQRLGQTPQGDRKIVPVLGGTVAGERITGTVLPGGGDWALTRPDGVLLLDVRLTIRTDDGALIHMTYDGMRHGSADVMARLAAGEHVPPDAMYFRIAPRFETGAQRYDWMNGILAVGIGERLPEGPRYHVHEVL
ncbi:MAG: DUF3237 domain-containing protein [Pararhodobacter sp.]|nr:DUF3237 domain-containing protein [Pararhodobacter sp.]